MAIITFKGNVVHTCGNLPAIGSPAPTFQLLRQDLTTVSLQTFTGKAKVLNIFPSLDTPVCANSVKQFRAEAARLKNTVVLNVSADLPFAQKRFCAAERIDGVEVLSTFRSTFSKDWNVEILDSPLAGLCSRVVIVLDHDDTVVYTEQVNELSQEPNYNAALEALKCSAE